MLCCLELLKSLDYITHNCRYWRLLYLPRKDDSNCFALIFKTCFSQLKVAQLQTLFLYEKHLSSLISVFFCHFHSEWLSQWCNMWPYSKKSCLSWTLSGTIGAFLVNTKSSFFNEKMCCCFEKMSHFVQSCTNCQHCFVLRVEALRSRI